MHLLDQIRSGWAPPRHHSTRGPQSTARASAGWRGGSTEHPEHASTIWAGAAGNCIRHGWILHPSTVRGSRPSQAQGPFPHSKAAARSSRKNAERDGRTDGRARLLSWTRTPGRDPTQSPDPVQARRHLGPPIGPRGARGRETGRDGPGPQPPAPLTLHPGRKPARPETRAVRGTGSSAVGLPQPPGSAALPTGR